MNNSLQPGTITLIIENTGREPHAFKLFCPAGNINSVNYGNHPDIKITSSTGDLNYKTFLLGLMADPLAISSLTRTPKKSLLFDFGRPGRFGFHVKLKKKHSFILDHSASIYPDKWELKPGKKFTIELSLAPKLQLSIPRPVAEKAFKKVFKKSKLIK